MERSGLDEREREGEKVEERCVNRGTGVGL